MAMSDDEPVWYASYGSNCRGARFAAYLTGSQANGTNRGERGARDPSPPTASEPHWFPQSARFLGDSKKWGGGGVAFLDHDLGTPAPGRRYLITKGQFDDVAAQESRRITEPLPIDTFEPGVVHTIGEGFYDGLLALDPIDGVPVVTFTSPASLSGRRTNPPSAAYLGTIVRGLAEVHPLEVIDLAEWIYQAPGVSDGWSLEQIAELAK